MSQLKSCFVYASVAGPQYNDHKVQHTTQQLGLTLIFPSNGVAIGVRVRVLRLLMAN